MFSTWYWLEIIVNVNYRSSCFGHSSLRLLWVFFVFFLCGSGIPSFFKRSYFVRLESLALHNWEYLPPQPYPSQEGLFEDSTLEPRISKPQKKHEFSELPLVGLLPWTVITLFDLILLSSRNARLPRKLHGGCELCGLWFCAGSCYSYSLNAAITILNRPYVFVFRCR